MAKGRRDSSGVFAVAEFRALWLASAQSVVGDQLARVALSVLVFQRTHSPLWTAATYALTLLPALVSGVLLAGLADRFPRRTVMVVCDLTRAVLVGLMALPGVPLPALAGILVLVQLAEAPFAAAQGASLPAILGDGRYERGQRVLLVTHQSGQLVGFAGAGLLVAWLGTHPALAVDAATFVVSAALVGLGIRARPSAGLVARLRFQVRDGARLIWSDFRLRTLVVLGCLAGLTVVPEGLAVPFAHHIGAGPSAVGFLLAADPLGMVAGAFLLGRVVGTGRRLELLGPLAIGTSLPLVGYVFSPGLSVALGLLVVSGACSAYQITAGATFVRLIPDHQRGQALGLARSALIVSQGLGVLAGGLVAQLSGSTTATIAAAGAAGTLCALAATAAWSRANPSRVAATLAVAEGVPA